MIPTRSDDRKRAHTKNSRGFTIVELLVAVAIIGLLAAIVVPNFFASLHRSKQVSTEATMRGYGISLARYYVDHDEYPGVDNIADLRLALTPCTLPAKDPWGHLFDYAVEVPKKAKSAQSAASAYSLQSFGSDGIDGVDISRATRHVYSLDLVYANGRLVASIEE